MSQILGRFVFKLVVFLSCGCFDQHPIKFKNILVCTRFLSKFILFVGRWIKIDMHQVPAEFFFISWQNFKSRRILSETCHTKACQSISQTRVRSPIKSSSLKDFRTPWTSKAFSN